jgi:hypothetical protein
VGAGEAELVTQEVREQRARFGLPAPHGTVDQQLDQSASSRARATTTEVRCSR